jgi:hypothetical protein
VKSWTCPSPDQAFLKGLCFKFWDRGLPPAAVNPVAAGLYEE